MRTYRGYMLKTAPLSGRTEIFCQHGEKIDEQPSVAQAEKTVDEWLEAR